MEKLIFFLEKERLILNGYDQKDAVERGGQDGIVVRGGEGCAGTKSSILFTALLLDLMDQIYLEYSWIFLVLLSSRFRESASSPFSGRYMPLAPRRGRAVGGRSREKNNLGM